jgi:hypothetical protein
MSIVGYIKSFPFGDFGPWAERELEAVERSIESIAALSISKGAGTPEGAIAAPVGSLYLRTDGGANTTLYIKESGTGNTGWVAK